jgi:hypothetical protein
MNGMSWNHIWYKRAGLPAKYYTKGETGEASVQISEEEPACFRIDDLYYILRGAHIGCGYLGVNRGIAANTGCQPSDQKSSHSLYGKIFATGIFSSSFEADTPRCGVYGLCCKC